MQEITTNESIRETMRGFDGVWSRVTSQQTAVSARKDNNTSCKDRDLREFIQNEQCAAQFDTCLARMLRGAARNMLLMQAAQAQSRARRLTAEYFLLTGDRCVRQERCDRADCAIDGLRDAFERNMEASRDYEQAAERTDDCVLRELYKCFSDETCSAADNIRSLIVRMF